MTKKVKLIKSFADYPVGEYEWSDVHERFVYEHPDGSLGIREFIHKDIIEGMKDHFEVVEEVKDSGRRERNNGCNT